MMGPERKSMVMSQKEKELTAWHEAGHAIVALNVPSADPVHKATIIPRGRALGMVMQLPTDDKLSMNKTEMVSRLAILMGGRVAEELKFGVDNVTAGAASDIQQATRLARAMITRWGFSDIGRPGRLRRGPGRGLPGQPDHASPRTCRKKPRARSRTKSASSWSAAWMTARRVLTEKRADWIDAGRGPARIRDADGRGDQGPHRGQAARPPGRCRSGPDLGCAGDQEEAAQRRLQRPRTGTAADLTGGQFK